MEEKHMQEYSFDAEKTGRIIESLRKTKKMSRKLFCDKADLSPSYLAMIEKGQAKGLSIDILLKVAAVLEVPHTDLL